MGLQEDMIAAEDRVLRARAEGRLFDASEDLESWLAVSRKAAAQASYASQRPRAESVAQPPPRKFGLFGRSKANSTATVSVSDDNLSDTLREAVCIPFPIASLQDQTMSYSVAQRD